jgi:hypothetical protein
MMNNYEKIFIATLSNLANHLSYSTESRSTDYCKGITHAMTVMANFANDYLLTDKEEKDRDDYDA